MASITFSGLASGIDWSRMADSIIALEHEPVYQLQDRQQQATSRKDMWGEIQSALEKVQTAATTLTKTSSLKFTSASSSAVESLQVSADSNAAVGTYAVTVDRLATSTRRASDFATQLGMSANVDLNQNLNLAASNLGGTFTGGYLTINGTQVAVNINADDPSDTATNDTVQELIDRINATVSGVTASYDAANDTLVFDSASEIVVGSPDDTSNFLKLTGMLNSADTAGGSGHLRTSTHRLGRINTSAELGDVSFGTALDTTGSFSINGVTINWNNSQSMNELISQINTKVTTVVASYDSQTDRILLASKQTGSLGITVGDITGNFLQAAGLLSNSGESQAAVTMGQNAKVTIEGFNNGQPIYSTSNKLTDVIPGVTLDLKKADPTETINVAVTRDTTELKAKINDFITQYNEAMGLIYTRMTEKPLDNAASVTTQRVGLLRGDSLLSTIKTNLSKIITSTDSTLPSDYNRLGNLGIGIDKNNVAEGTLTFNADTFDDLMDENFEQAYDVFFADADGDGKVDDGEGGILPKLLAQINSVVDDTTQDYNGTAIPLGDIARRMWTLNKDYTSFQSRIDNLEARLALREEALRARFNAAEQAIAKLTSGSSALSAYYGSG